MWSPDPSIIITAAQRDAGADAAAWEALRSERDRLLALSDYTQVADWPGDAAPWRAYRQALRDLPGNTDDPSNPVWPDAPVAS